MATTRMLRPWHDVERYLDLNDDDTAWARQPYQQHHFGRLCEALDLLVLLAVTDANAWQNEARGLWLDRAYNRSFSHVFRSAPHPIGAIVIVNVHETATAVDPRVTMPLACLRTVRAAIAHELPVVGKKLWVSISGDDVARAETVATLLGAVAAPQSTPPYRLGAIRFTKLRMNLVDAPTPTPSLVSAAYVSQTLRRINMDDDSWSCDDQNRLHMWRWLAYAFWSRHATGNIQEMKLCVSAFTHSHLDSVRAIVQAEHPLAILFNVPATKLPAFVSASIFRLVQPDATKDSSPVVVFNTPSPIRVRPIQRNVPIDGYWRVLQPGKGEAWVHDDDVDETWAEDTVSSHWHVHVTVDRLQTASMAPTASLLELLGDRVSGLAIARPSSWSVAWCERALECCRRIDTLDLCPNGWNAVRVGADTQVGWYNAGLCRASELTINVAERTWESRRVASFLYAFCDANSPLAACVTALHLGASLETASGSDASSRHRGRSSTVGREPPTSHAVDFVPH